MIDKKLLIGICLILSVALLISGCGVSDYITGEAENEQDYSLLTDNLTDEDLEEDLETDLNETEEVDLNETDEVDLNETEEEQEIEMTEEGEIVVKVYENDTVELKPNVYDADEDALEFTFTDPLDNEGAWKTDFGDAGQYLVTVSVSDGNLETSREVMIVVQRLNVPPVIESIAPITVDEGDTVELEPEVSDPNGDEFEITIGEPVGLEGIWEIDYQSAGEYTVTITATDFEGASSEIEVPITVNKKNVPPVIELFGEEELIVDEGDTVELDIEITDPNGDEIEITISDPVGNDKIWDTDYTDHGEYTITISATDGTATSTKELSLIVNDVNMPPEIIDIINIGGGYAPECIIDGDCDGDEICVDYECELLEDEADDNETTDDDEEDDEETDDEECYEDNDCEDDLVCVENACIELKEGCEDDNDCEGDLICVDGFCE